MSGCPFLEEDIGGFYCRATGVCVEYIDGADTGICIESGYTHCHIFNALQQDNLQKVVIKLKSSD